MKKGLILAYIFLFLLAACSDDDANSPATPTPNCTGLEVYEETEGLLIIEAEDFNDSDSINEWVTRTNSVNGISAFSGSGYIFYQGENSFQEAGKSILSYNIRINSTGVYRFLFAAAIGTGDNNTEHNDAFVKFPDADAFYAYKESDNSIAIPNDEGVNANNPDPADPILMDSFPNATYKVPEGSNRKNNGYFKVYMNQLEDWWYEGSTSDSDAHKIYVRFDSPGTYTMLMSGRSSSFAVDRVVLYKEEGSFENLGNRNNRKATFDTLGSVQAICL